MEQSGKLRGLMLRSQLITLLKMKAFNETALHWTEAISPDHFQDDYPRYPSVEVPYDCYFSTDYGHECARRFWKIMEILVLIDRS
jgi:hypothetical protein